MNLDDIQKAWQAQDSTVRISIPPDSLLKEVRRNDLYFRAMIFWRDVREVGVAAVMAAFFFYTAATDKEWLFFLLGLTTAWVGLFMVVDRLLQKRKESAPDESLVASAERALQQVEHQIWLLKNVLWWYILPPGSAVVILIGSATWAVTWALRSWVELLKGGGAILLAIAIFYGVYLLNQYAVRAELQPRQAELKSLLETLREA